MITKNFWYHGHMLTNQQSLSLRYAQGLGIIAVVLGHYGIVPPYIFEPYTFHMPLFFLLGGILFKETSIFKTIKSILIKHLWYVVYTYLIISVIAIFISSHYNVSIGEIYSTTILSTIKNIFNRNFHNNGYFLVAWFLFSYALASLLCRIIIYIKKQMMILCIALSFGFMGMDYVASLYAETGNQIYNLTTQVLVGSMFYLIGFVFKRTFISMKSLYIPIISMVIIFTMKNFGVLGGLMMSWSKYPQGFIFHTLSSLLSICTILAITNAAATQDKKLNLLALIGSKSKIIMSYHLLTFTVLDIIFYKLEMYDMKNASYLNHYSTPKYWFFYIAIGITLPIIVSLTLDCIKKININELRGKNKP